jgi:hypothetical protein
MLNNMRQQRHSIIGVCELQSSKMIKLSKKSKILPSESFAPSPVVTDKLYPLKDLYDGMSNYFTPTGRRTTRNPLYSTMIEPCDFNEENGSFFVFFCES